MNKEEWQKIRGETEFPLNIFYEFWCETKPSHYKELSLGEFEKLFPEYIASKIVVEKNGHPHVFDYERCITKIFNYFDKKFEL